MSETADQLTDEGLAQPGDETYTAIVYFHGMGTPRRHEEISRLTDALDQYSSKLDEGSVGRLRKQKVLFEPSRMDDDEDVAFVQIIRVVKRFGRSYRPEGRLRIYEGYWSPYAASDSSWFRVFAWLLLRFTNPLRVLFAHPWRAHQRLKLATLYRMHNKNTDAALDSVYRQLESFYIGYENWAARRIAPLGNFRSFVRHVLEKLSKAAPAKKQRIVDLANKWRRRFVLEQLGLLAAILTVAAAALDTLLFVFYFCASGANFLFPHSAFSAALFETIPQVPYPILTLPLIAFFLGIFFWKARLYLSTFWADVMFWTTQEEKSIYFSKRREILRAATHALSHVLQDNNCRRVVVIGHSLGSAIAYESLLRLGRRRLARESSGSMPIELARLDIVSHLVTIGSPIDWIHYFFELHDSRFHRYNRIRDILKGSTDSIPFKNNGEACTRWINIWDDADPMSTKLFSPRGRTPNARAIYDLWAPSSHCMGPATAHTGYFMSEISVQALLWISMFGRLPKELEVGRIFRGVQAFIFNFVRPGMKLLAALLVWIALICGTMFLFFDASWSILLFPAAILLILIVGWVATLLADQMWPLRFDGAVP